MRVCWLVAFSIVSVPLCAQPAPPPGSDQTRPQRSQVFIAPSGKPFRAAQGMPYPLATWFAAADTNHDGKIDANEFRADFAAFFNELDVNHDGRISSDEITRYENEVAPEVQVGSAAMGGGMMGAGKGRGMGGGHRRGGGGGGGMGRGGGGPSGGMDDEMGGNAQGGLSADAIRRMEDMPRGAGMFGLINSPEPVAAMDTDMSGSVTRAEAQGAADRRFHMLDPDNKGFVTLASLPEVPILKMRGKMRDHKRSGRL